MKESDYEDAVINFYEGLYAFGYSLTGKEDDASELTQETFYRLLARGATVRDASKIKSWLFTTLYRIFLDWEQRRALLPHFEISSVENELAPVSQDQMDVLLENAVRDSLLELEERYRAPLLSKSEIPVHRKGKSVNRYGITDYLSGRAAPMAFAILLIASSVTPVFAQYKRTDLASNQPGVAPSTDQQHLINAWGLTALPTGPWWLSDNGSGFSTLYNGSGQQNPLFVTIPASPSSPAGTAGTPTGIVGNISPSATDFIVTGNGKSGPARFIFATPDGTISAWNPSVDGVLPGPGTGTTLSHATIVADHAVPGATYTGLAIATDGGGQTFLYAADGGANRAVDIYDGTFAFVKSFGDPEIGIQAINGEIWVTFTALNKAQGGFVDVFATDGTLLRHDALHGPLHSPWGIAQAPADFGPMSNAILIGNNTSQGRVNAFDPKSGGFLGPLRDADGNPIEIDNVWALQFGQDGGPNGLHNQLFFTGGPNGYANGIFGVITFGQ